MVDIVHALGEALNKDMEAINHIAQNLANVNTPGYKSTSLVSKGVDFSHSVMGDKSVPEIKETTSTVYDFKSGSLKQSKRALDIAVVGDAFFKISVQGKEVYSRNGSLGINQDGVLVNALGFPMLTEQGELKLDGPNNIKIESNGSLLQNGNFLGKISLVRFKELQHVTHIGNGMLATTPRNVENVDDGVFHQGYIESSNVNTSHEMVRMMELSKHFESVQKALSVYDQALSNGINKIGQ